MNQMNEREWRGNKFPTEGRPWSKLVEEIQKLRSNDMAWTDLRNLKASYNAGEGVHDASWEAYTMYQGDNYLYGSLLYPSLNKMADDIVAMALEMFAAPEEGLGTVTTGGTESILLAVKAARDWAAANRSVPGVPEIIAPKSAHASLNKGSNITGIRVVRVPVKDFRADTAAIEKAVNENTIMVYGSAPCYPFGCVDPIDEMSRIALKHNLWLHVDACVGGFFLPFARHLGERIPDFDFQVPGVKSISADLHKYGYTARGASLLLLRDKGLAEYQMLKFDDWPMGPFNAMTVSGSRPGGAVVSAWAVMNYLGIHGYVERVGRIIEIRRQLISRLKAISGIRICGEPEAGVVGVVGEGGTDMNTVRQILMDRGWRTGPLFDPQGFNVLLNWSHGEILDDFTKTLREIVEHINQGRYQTKGKDETYGV